MRRASSGAGIGMRLMIPLALCASMAIACVPDSKSAGEIPSNSDSGDGGSSDGDGDGDSVGQGESDEGGASCEAVVAADDFDRSCDEHADCVTVFEGASTDACRECAFSAINAGDQQAYNAALGPLSCSAAECGAGCLASPGDPGACVDGQCELGQTFACGDETCNAAVQFCVLFGTDIVGEPAEFGCQDLPEACVDSTDCQCLVGSEGDINFGFCVESGSCEHDGITFQLTCPGG